jgi:TRAP transporter TAXI family solute receptor
MLDNTTIFLSDPENVETDRFQTIRLSSNLCGCAKPGYRIAAVILVAWLFLITDEQAAFPLEGDSARISVLIATGMPGDTRYQVGLGMASLWTTRLRRAGIRVSAAVSEGPKESIEALRIADADLILVDDLFCSLAFRGQGMYRGRRVKELRGIAALWDDALHLLIRSDRLKTGSLIDLDGLTLATGLPGSGNRIVTEILLKALGRAGPMVSLRSMSNRAAVEALRRQTIDALAMSGGIPIPLINSLLKERGLSLGFLGISDAQMTAIRETGGGQGLFTTTIPSGTYPGQERALRTVGRRILLVVTSSLDKQVVHALTKTLFDNLDYLARLHPACRDLDVETALEGMNIPLHEGAFTYYQQRQIEVPENLRPKKRRAL